MQFLSKNLINYVEIKLLARYTGRSVGNKEHCCASTHLAGIER